MPCQRYTYSAYEIVVDNWRKFYKFTNIQYPFGPKNLAIISLNFPRNELIKMVKEVERYSLGSFVGEFGGTLGLFLGLSFWGFFQGIVQIFSHFKCKKFTN